MKIHKVTSAIVGASIAFTAFQAQADYIQSLGISEACVSMGGACAATSDDFGAYYSNPAGATQFDRPLLGGNFRIIDTRNLELKDSDGNHDIPRTNTRGNQALAPTVAAYVPVTENLVAGIALGAPFAITADWTNDDGIHRYNMTDQALFLLDLSPNFAYKFNDRLSVGLAANITALKHLRTETLIPNTFLLGLPTSLGGLGSLIDPTPTSPISGSVTLETDRKVRLGIPPDGFAVAFDEGTMTAGIQYRLSEQIKLGATYRHLTRTEWEGDATFALPLLLGQTPQTTRFKAAIDMPGHAQIGLAYQPMRSLLWTLDAQRTFWSDTRGFGSPVEIKFEQPLLGLVNELEVDYGARDTMTYRTGLRYAINETFSVMGGYAFDEHIFPDNKVDVLTYDSDRHIGSLGGKIDLRGKDGGGLIIVGALQVTHYQSRTIREGQSQNLGGVSQPNLELSSGTLGFVPNTEDFTFGGNIFALGLSLSYEF